MLICAWCTVSGEAGSMAQLNPRTPVESWRCSRFVSGAEDNTIGRPEALPKKTSSERVPGLNTTPPNQTIRSAPSWHE